MSGYTIRPVLAVVALLAAARFGAAQQITVSPSSRITFDTSVGVGITTLSITPGTGTDKVPFKCQTAPAFTSAGKPVPDFLVVSPSSGIAPATIQVYLNFSIVPYMLPLQYGSGIGCGPVGQPATGGTNVSLIIHPTSPPAVASVLDTATLQPSISPGALVTVFGSNLGTPPVTGQYSSDGLYPTNLGNTTVSFNSFAAPLLYVSPGQVNAVVPYEVAGQKTVSVLVTHDFQTSSLFTMPLADTSPGLLTVSQNGSGPAVVKDTFSGGLNSADNPAPKGSVIDVFGSGAGLWKQPLPSGAIALFFLPTPFNGFFDTFIPPYVPAAAVSLTIGGAPSKVLYAGAAPFQVSGMLQVTAVVPDAVASGAQPIVLTIGSNNNAAQQVTVFVK